MKKQKISLYDIANSWYDSSNTERANFSDGIQTCAKDLIAYADGGMSVQITEGQAFKILSCILTFELACMGGIDGLKSGERDYNWRLLLKMPLENTICKIRKGNFIMTKEKALEILENMNDYDLMMYWNEFSNEQNRGDEIYMLNNFEFNDFFSEPEDAVRAVYYGDFNYSDECIYFNGYGNLVTFCDLLGEKSPICLDELADYLSEHYDENDF